MSAYFTSLRSSIMAASGMTTVTAAIASYIGVVTSYPSPLQTKALHSEVEVNGKKKFVIGYTGHHMSTFKAIAAKDKNLYFGYPEVAQTYALKNGKATAHRPAAPAIGMVVADQPVEHLSYSASEYGAFQPVTPAQQRALNVEVLDLTIITPENRMGFIGSAGRMKTDLLKRLNRS